MQDAAKRRVVHLSSHLTAAQPTDSRVLAGVKVVELATVIAAPSCCAVLADLGADVVKVEAPAGDMWRSAGLALQLPPHGDTGRSFSSQFDNNNRGKRSVVLDIASPAGLKALRALIAAADVFVTNVRLAALQRKQLDYEQLRHDHPRLIFAHLTAWGREGPRAGDAGYDIGAFWAGSGMMDLVRASDSAEPPRFPGGVGDHTASMQLAAGIAFALYHRERTGRGQLVDACLSRAGIWTMGFAMMMAAMGHPDSPRVTREQTHNPAFTAYRCKDGQWLQLLGLEFQKHLPLQLDALGITQRLVQLGLATTSDQMRNRSALLHEMDAAFATRSRAEWMARFRERGVWHCEVARIEDVLEDEQAHAAHAFECDVPGVEHPLVACPVRLSCSDQHKPRACAPALGAHTASVLGGLNEAVKAAAKLTADDVAALISASKGATEAR